LGAMRDSLGLTDKFPDKTLNFITADDENINRFSGVRAAMVGGRLGTEEGIGIANNPDKFAEFSGQPASAWQAPSDEEMELLLKAGEFGRSQQTQVLKTQMTGDAAMGRQQYDTSVKAKEAADAKIGVDYSKFITAGGMANAEEKLRKLEEAAKKLEDGKIKTGTGGLSIATGVPFVEAKKILSRTHPELKALMDDVEGAVNLKQALDSAFSDAAAAQVMSRAFDANLSPKQNAAKIRSVINELRSDIKIKMGEFDRVKLLSPEMRSEFMKGNAPAAAAADSALPVNRLKQAMQRDPDAVNKFRAQAKARGMSAADIEKMIKQSGGK